MTIRLSIVLLLFLSLRLSASTDECVIRVAGENYAPYIDEHLPNNGWAWDIVEAALVEVGCTATIEFMSWQKSMIEGMSGKNIDAIYPAFLTKKRQEWFVFSSPIGKSAIGLFKLQSREDIHYNGNLSSLAGLKIGGCSACQFGTEYEINTDIIKVTAKDTQSVIKMLSLGELDLMVGNFDTDMEKIRAIANTYSKFSNIDQEIIFMKPPLEVNTLHLAISKKSKKHIEILSAFNKGLEIIIDNGTYEEILKRHGTESQL